MTMTVTVSLSPDGSVAVKVSLYCSSFSKFRLVLGHQLTSGILISHGHSDAAAYLEEFRIRPAEGVGQEVVVRIIPSVEGSRLTSVGVQFVLAGHRRHRRLVVDRGHHLVPGCEDDRGRSSIILRMPISIAPLFSGTVTV